MPSANAEALELPDQLLVRYFRAGESEHVQQVTPIGDKRRCRVQLVFADWRDFLQ